MKCLMKEKKAKAKFEKSKDRIERDKFQREEQCIIKAKQSLNRKAKDCIERGGKKKNKARIE